MTDQLHLPPLGWTPGPVDERDLQLSALAGPTPTLRGERRWHYEGQAVLNQGKEGACVLFSESHGANSEPRRKNLESAFAQAAYRRVTEVDEFRGNWRTGQSGTSLRSGAKEMVRQGVFKRYAFAYTVEEIVSHLLSPDGGPVCIGVDWYRSCDRPEVKDGAYYCRVRPESGRRGGHAVALVGAHWGLGDDNYVVLMNSWGPNGYGFEGRARVSEAGLRIWARSGHFTALTFVD